MPPRAALHNALVLDRDIFEASKTDASLLDPVVRVDGGLPGTARPIAVVRDYQGPQGAQIERFVLLDSRGREVVESVPRRIDLRGQMFEDRFVDVLSNVRIERGEEHQMSFFVNDHEIATIPVFIEAGLGGDPTVAAEETFNKALSKGAVVWVTVDQPRGPAHSQAIWYVWTDGKVYVLDGPTEQQVPGLVGARRVLVTARSKDLRSRVAEIPASVTVIPNDSDRFDVVARMALGRRLNLPDGDGALERWRTNCTMLELTPHFGAEPAPLPDGRAAAPAAPARPQASPPQPPAEKAPAAAAPAASKPAAKATTGDDVHVEAQVDQAVYDKLVAEGASDRVARAKAKAAYVRAERARLRSEGGS